MSGTPWRLGAVGLARWRGVALSNVLRLAGIRPSAVDVMPHNTQGCLFGAIVRHPVTVSGT